MTSNIPTADNDNVLSKDGNTPDWAKGDTNTAAVVETPAVPDVAALPKETEEQSTPSLESKRMELERLASVRGNFPEASKGEPLQKVIEEAEISNTEANALIADVAARAAADIGEVPVNSNVSIDKVDSSREKPQQVIVPQGKIDSVVEKGGANDNKPEIASSTPEREALRDAVLRATGPSSGEDLKEVA